MIAVDSELMSILRSPGGAPLSERDGDLVTEHGDERFLVVAGVPLFLDPDRSLFARHAFTESAAAPRSRVRRLRGLLRARLIGSPVSRRNFLRMTELLAPARGDRRLVLVIGGGILGFGIEPLLGNPGVKLLETDVYIGPRTAVVCDAQQLPFVDGAFDGVVVQAVLEHVIDPGRVAAEIHRVLKPGGVLYSEIPFMQQVHEGAYDFTRFTLGGHRALFRGFDEVDAGPVGGPGEALAWSVSYFISAFARSDVTRARIRAATTLLTLPLRWSDRLLEGGRGTADAASGTYFIGLRAERSLSDEEIVAAYAGSIANPDR
jgi:SAM-dependent methyltransferase